MTFLQGGPNFGICGQILRCGHSNKTSSAVLSHGTIYFVFLSLWMKSYGVTIQMKPLQQYFHMAMVLFI